VKNITTPRNLIYAAALLLFTGCGKLQGTVEPTVITPSHTTTSDSYQPVTKGSYWQYKVTTNGVTDTSTITMTGLMTLYDNKTYYEASKSFKSHKFPDATDYFSHNNHALTKLTISNADTLEEYYFNDTTALNGVWMAKVNHSGYINGAGARFVGTLVEQNISFTVAGATYTGVSHAKVFLQYSLEDNGYTTAETYDLFLVKGIGPVAIYTTSDSGLISSEELIAYSIK